MSTTNGSVTISNPPPPPADDPPPAPTTPSLSGPTSAYYSGNINYTWSAAPDASYYLFGYQFKDANNNVISSISDTSMVNIGNVTSRSIAISNSAPTNPDAKTLYGILVACNSGGCGNFSNSIATNLSSPPPPIPSTPILSSTPSSGNVDSGGTVTFTFGSVSDATSYKLKFERDSTWDGGYTVISNGGTQYAFTVSGIRNTLRAKGVACNSSGCSGDSTPTSLLNVTGFPANCTTTDPSKCLSLSPSSVTIVQGQSGSTILTVSNSQADAFHDPLGAIPAGMTFNWNPDRTSIPNNPTCTAQSSNFCTSVLRVNVTSATPPGVYNMQLDLVGPQANIILAVDVQTPQTSGYIRVNDAISVTTPYNSLVTLSWACSAGTVAGQAYSVQNSTFSNSSLSNSGVSAGPLTSNLDFKLKCSRTTSLGLDTVVDTAYVTVQAPTLDVSMSHSASPSSHTLSGGQVITSSSVVVGGTATGNITYNFNCANGSPVQTTTVSNTSRDFSCTYTSAGTYNPRVTISRGVLSASTNEFVTIYNPITVDIKANNSHGPVSIFNHGSANLTWTSNNASSCASSGAWGVFDKSLNNTAGESTGTLSSTVGTYTYTLSCANGGGGSVSDSVTVSVTNPPTIVQSTPPIPPNPIGAPSCYASPNPALVNDSVTWTAHFSGGIAPYGYKWSFQSGSNTTNSSPVSGITSYASTGSKTASVDITSSDGQNLNITCSKDINGNALKVYYPAITGSCSADKDSANTGEAVTWSTSSVSGGSGAYSYSWSGTDTLSGSKSSVKKTYSTSGSKTATVRITSGVASNYPSGTNNYTDLSCTIPNGESSIPISYPAVSVTCYPDSTTAYPGQTRNWAVNYISGGDGSYTYSWTGTDSLSCSGQPLSSCENVNKQYSQTGDKTASVTAYSGGLSATSQCSNSVNVTATADPTATISASVNPVAYNSSATISWTSGNASSCSVTKDGNAVGGWTGTSNSKSTGNLTRSAVYRVTCSGINEKSGVSATSEVTVKVGLTLTCSVSPTETTTTFPVTWKLDSANGGSGSYTYSWSGTDGLSGNTASVDKIYSNSPGPKSGTITVTSSDNVTGTCTPTGSTPSVGGGSGSVSITIKNPLGLTCSASPTSTSVNNNVTWSATASEGTGSYTYSWSSTDGEGLKCTGQPKPTCNSVDKSYSTAGIKNGTVTATSGNETKTCTPSSSVTISNKPSVSSFTTTNANIIQGESVTLNWSCADSTTSSGTNFSTGGVTSGSVSVSPNTTTTYTATCTNSINESTSSSQTVNVTPQSLNISLSVSPTSGRAPLSVITTATVTGNMPPGTTSNYSFWWNCNNATTNLATAIGACGTLPSPVPGTCQTSSTGAKCDGMSAANQSLTFIYQNQGSYTAKVIAERGVVTPKEARASVTVDYPTVEPATGQSQTKTSSANSPVTFSVQGGTGSYGWDAPNRCTPRTGSGSTFTVSCDKSGSYTITVTSGSQSMDFTLIVASTILNFNASPRVVNPGQSTTLSWLTTGYQSCSIDQGIGTVSTDSGTKTIFYKEGVTQTTYTLVCVYSGNKQDSSQVTVNISKVPKLKEIVPR
ncbi:MAG: hypothetical protein Q8R29_01590 [bacterium]|nr:hypothetical protein [bacterium]